MSNIIISKQDVTALISIADCRLSDRLPVI